MGLNFRKSISIGKHSRINLSKSGIGFSTGVKGARVSVGPRGVRKTVGIPGTGVYYTKQESLNKLKQGNTSSYNNGQAINKKKTGCGCFSIIAAFIIICAIFGGLTGGDKKETQTAKTPTSKTQISKKQDTTTKAQVSKPAKQNTQQASNQNTASASSESSNQNNNSSSTTAASTSQASQNNNQNITVYVTKSGKKYHLAGCRELKKGSTAISLKDAKAQGYTPCKICNPPQ